MNPTYVSLETGFLDDEVLHSIRREVYHSEGPGYFVFRKFIPIEYTKHIFDYWTKIVVPSKSHKKFISRELLKPGSPNYYTESANGSRTFYNPFWNSPTDEVTHEVCFKIAQLRNQIESRPCFSEIFPVIGRRCVIPRIVITKKGENILAPHSDYGLSESNPANIDLRRTQATLYLSKFGKDYGGSGFIFTVNQGNQIQMEKELNLNPGDLVIWKYSNTHSIDNIDASEEDAGFVRILFPPEKLSQSRNQFFGARVKRLTSRVLGKLRKLSF